MSQQQSFGTGGGGGTGILTITGSDAIPVPADAFNNINLIGGGGVTVLGNAGAFTATIYTNDGGATGTGQTIGAVSTNLIILNLGAVPGTYLFTVQIAGFDITTPLGAAYWLNAAFRATGAAAVEINDEYGSEFEEGILANCDYDIAAAGNTAVISVTGVAGETINWKASLTYTFRS
jgi:hypothetical protein